MNLSDSVSVLPFVGPSYERRLKKLEIVTISDLLHHVPNRYLDFSKTTKIKDLKIGEVVTVVGKINSIKNQITKSRKLMQIGQIEDDTGKIIVVWFNQPYLTRLFYPDTKIAVSGEISWFAGKPAFFSPEYEKFDRNHESVHTGKIVGVYPETTGLSSKWLKARIKYALDRVEIKEFLDEKTIEKYKLIKFNEAIYKTHFPKTLDEAKTAKERLSFNEFFNILVQARQRKAKLIRKKCTPINIDRKEIDKFVKSLPFKLTDSQLKVSDEILTDLNKNIPMNRLLQGDVGSGKTVVSVIASLPVIQDGLQVVFLAPTQILANQHYETIKKLLDNLKIRVSLITGTQVKKDLGRTDIFVGTHALINKTKEFEKIGLLIIDEHHKFGVKQSEFLKGKNPHKLTMTATPIPRTIAQTLFADMDLSILTEIPENRPKVKTWLVPNEKREGAYFWIKKEITKNKTQAFVICPLIEDSEAETMKDIKSVKNEYKKLKTIFSDFKLGLLHGKLKEKEKNKVLNDFKDKKLDILVSTPVVEVGIDIVNATIMVIEGSDRFGLAALHQLRGRVGRGTKKSYCLLFTENESEKVKDRLINLAKTNSGFELAELDLKLRGGGEVLGLRQHGFGDLKIANWSQTDLIKKVTEAVANFVNVNYN